MNVIIFWNQSVFIPGRIIYDNIMIAHEMLHSLNKLRKGKNGKMAVKLVMSKAYDWVVIHWGSDKNPWFWRKMDSVGDFFYLLGELLHTH